MSKTIHIIGAGGPAGVGLARCLSNYYSVYGFDSNGWSYLMMESRKGTARIPDMVISVPDSKIMDNSFCSPLDQIEICQNKLKTADLIAELAPKRYWGRDKIGAGGQGAEMISEYLPGRNFSVEFVYFAGKKLASFQKQRLSYSVKERTQGIENVGSSAVSVCTANPLVFENAEMALKRLPGTLHGFYGVDLVEDSKNIPKVTEINAGRLLTASYSYYWLTGYNLPLIGVKAFLGEDIPPLPEYPEGQGIIRQIDQLPKLFPPEVTKDWL